MPTSENVRVAVTGGVYKGPPGATLPTNATTALAGSFIELGYVSDEGVAQAIAAATTIIRAWQNGTNVRTVQTEHDLTYALTLIETSAETLEAYYGNYSTGVVEINAAQLGRAPWVIEVTDGDNHIRIVIPDGQITDRGDITLATDTAIGYQITITAYEDPDYDGAETSPAKAYVYLDVEGS